jgi:hypothetical protein
MRQGPPVIATHQRAHFIDWSWRNTISIEGRVCSEPSLKFQLNLCRSVLDPVDCICESPHSSRRFAAAWSRLDDLGLARQRVMPPTRCAPCGLIFTTPAGCAPSWETKQDDSATHERRFLKCRRAAYNGWNTCSCLCSVFLCTSNSPRPEGDESCPHSATKLLDEVI